MQGNSERAIFDVLPLTVDNRSAGLAVDEVSPLQFAGVQAEA